MSVLSRFERRLGGAVEGGFSRVFRSRVEPVELAVALKKEADGSRAVGPNHTLVPNQYEIDLAPSDYDRLAPYRLTLGDELAEIVREHASEQRYTFVGPVEVTLVRAEELRTGAYRVGSRVEAAGEPARTPPPAAPRPTPPAAPSPGWSVPAALVPAEVPWDVPVAFPAEIPAELPAADRPVGARDDLAMTTALPRARSYGRLELPGGELVELGPAPVVVGRGHEADVRLADASVSRRHAEFRPDGDRMVVEDLGSTNGTTVAGERIARAVLVDGDRIAVGAATIVFRA